MIVACDHLDAFFDGELHADAAGAFRDHLASCPHCESALRGRMLEAMVVSNASQRQPSLARGSMPPVPPPSLHRRRIAIGAAGVIALAAAASIALFVRPSPSPHHAGGDPLATSYDIERGPNAMRGQTAHVGDTLHLHAHATVWIYRGDHQLVLACAADAPCELHVAAIGAYSIVTLAGAVIPSPHGSFDDDVAAAVEAGAKYRVEQLDVQ